MNELMICALSKRRNRPISRRIMMTASVVMVLALVACTGKRALSEQEIQSRYPHARTLMETARFLAGTDLAPDSALAGAAKSPNYAAYRAQVERLWNQYRERQLQQIEAWRDRELKAVKTRTLFYPFSGPDILNALAFFPGAEEIIMVGLEKPGTVPNPGAMPAEQVHTGLWNITRALRTLLSLNLFRTSEMQADLKADSYNSITGIMMFFLTRSGYEILDIRPVHMKKEGGMADGAAAGPDAMPGVEFTFRKGPGAPVKQARYFSIDLSDKSLEVRPGVTAYLRQHREFNTFLKSASYLLSYAYFATVRGFILERSEWVIQGDSGIPLKSFDPKRWDISVYGRYRVLEMFANRYQADLDALVKAKSKGPLPFSFDYGFVPKASAILVARRTVKE